MLRERTSLGLSMLLFITEQDFVREMVSQGNVKNMAKTLAVLAGAERRESARHAAEVNAAAAMSGPASAITQPGGPCALPRFCECRVRVRRSVSEVTAWPLSISV